MDTKDHQRTKISNHTPKGFNLDPLQGAFAKILDNCIENMDDDSDERDLEEEARQQYEQDNLDAPADIPEEPDYHEELPTE